MKGAALKEFYARNAAKGRTVRFSMKLDARAITDEQHAATGLSRIETTIERGTLTPDVAKTVLDAALNGFAKTPVPPVDLRKLSRAAMLLMREVLCEQVFRQMQQFELFGTKDLVEHPCRSLKLRDITPERLELFVKLEILDMDKATLRAHAARVLDACEGTPPTK